jgi:hypothetical protein
MPQRCGNCLASQPFRAPDANGKPAVLGTCHLNPPVPLATPEGIKSVYPIVNPFNGWCLNWSPKPGFDDRGDREEPNEPQAPPAKLITET